MAKSEKKDCDCVTKVQALVREKLNAPEGDLECAMTIFPEMRTFPRMRFLYHKLKNGVPMKKQEEHTIFPSYCPFCGKKYREIKTH